MHVTCIRRSGYSPVKAYAPIRLLVYKVPLTSSRSVKRAPRTLEYSDDGYQSYCTVCCQKAMSCCSVAIAVLRLPVPRRHTVMPTIMSEMSTSWTANLSFGASTDPHEPRTGLSRTGHTIVAVFLGFILAFGFMNNLIVLILFCKFKTLRNPVNMLLLNISASDMLVCISGTTLSFASNIHGRWIGGEYGCMWYGFVNSCFGKSLKILSYTIIYNMVAVESVCVPSVRLARL
ncbi:Opsin-3 [Chelonia mydas]|uniref:Opsin-3 n=1 Tax=Chelonia mydas TaxID=8469 RepID=M7AQH4_CHEMY|nr:Opsin-3 [Chelonia mydas]